MHILCLSVVKKETQFHFLIWVVDADIPMILEGRSDIIV